MKYRAWHIICLLLIALLAQSCVNDYDACEDDRLLTGEVNVRFTLKMDAPPGGSRSGVWNPNGTGDSGSSFDRAIHDANGNQWLYVIVINDATGAIAPITIKTNDGGNNYMYNSEHGGYDIDATIDFGDNKGDWTAGEYRIMAFVNLRLRETDSGEKKVLDARTMSDLKSAIGNRPIDWYNNLGDHEKKGIRNTGNFPNIPMWGVTTTRLFLDGINTETFTIDLLRSLAKVKLELNDKLKDAGFRLVSAEVSKWNKKSNCLPANWDVSTGTSDKSVKYDAAFNVNRSKYEKLVVDAPGVSGEYDDDESLVFYLPEWDAKNDGAVTLTVTLQDATGGLVGPFSTDVSGKDITITNEPLGSSRYGNNINNVNRNHVYNFEFDYDVEFGTLSYKLNCWDYSASGIGWNPTSYSFFSDDLEGKAGFLTFPAYPSDNKKDEIENNSSFADYEFALTEPEGAVWKAFLVQEDINGVERCYSVDDVIRTGNGESTVDSLKPYEGLVFSNTANTPTGFFFQIGNEDYAPNQKAVTTGIARPEPYRIKVGTRLSTTDYADGNPILEDGSPVYEKGNKATMALNSNGEYWKTKNDVPKCYLVIKVALDGKHFSEELKINPAGTGDYEPYTFAGSETRIELRQLCPFYVSKETHNNDRLSRGNTPKNDSDYLKYCWWGLPESHKDYVAPEPDGPETDKETETEPAE